MLREILFNHTQTIQKRSLKLKSSRQGFSRNTQYLMGAPEYARKRIYSFLDNLIGIFDLEPGDSVKISMPVKFNLDLSTSNSPKQVVTHTHSVIIYCLRDGNVELTVEDDHSKLANSIQLINQGGDFYYKFKKSKGNNKYPQTLRVSGNVISNFYILFETIYGALEQTKVSFPLPSGKIKEICSCITLKKAGSRFFIPVSYSDPRIINSLELFTADLQKNNPITHRKA
ncbi:MAG: hypothetical protein SFU25_09705 [Candidatus Caenarcaniphilales bacterium]|nr:hypothetical protein [Candidatus Caenarcaniphilales bacterium]